MTPNKNHSVQSSLHLLENELIQLTSTKMGRRSFLAASSLLLAACATQDQHRYREGQLSGAETDLTVNDERKLTSDVLPKMKKDYPALNNSEIQDYIRNLGRKLATSNQVEGKPYFYNFTVVDINMVNAFALPAGTIFVTAPLIAMADSEAELAGVLGHEMGHIKARHTAIRMTEMKKQEGSSNLLTAGGALLGGALGYGLSKVLCPPNDEMCIKKSVGYGLAAGAMGGLLIQKYKFMANSREDEMEADRIGFKTSVNAGYDKNYCGLFYEKLLKMEQNSKANHNMGLLNSVADAMSTHPPSVERVKQMNEMAIETVQSSQTVISSIQFEKIKKKCQEIVKNYDKKKPTS